MSEPQDRDGERHAPDRGRDEDPEASRDPYAAPTAGRVPPRDSERDPEGSTGSPAPRAPRRGRERPGGQVDAGGRRAFLLAAAGLFLTVLLFPAMSAAPLGIVLAVAGIVLGVRARRRAAAAGGTAPGAIAAIVTGALTAAMAAVLGLALLIFLDEVRDYRDCILGANTEVARSGCEETLRDRIADRTGVRP